MKRFTRLLALCLSLIFALGCFVSCGKQPHPDEPTDFVSEAVSTTEAAEPESAVTEAETEAVTQAPAETTETQTQAPTSAPAEETTEKLEETEEAEKMPQTKEEIITLYNDSVNRVKTESKAIVSNYTLNTQTKDAVISNKMLQSIANKLISANMGYDKKKANITYATPTQIMDAFPVRGQKWSSHLTSADVTKATCTEKDGVYTVTLYLVPDTTPNIKADQGHAGKAFSLITKDSIVEGAGTLGMSVIEEDSIKLTFKDCRITAKIDKETGRVSDVNYYMDWTLALTAIGIDVAVSFGSEDDFTIIW